MRVVLTAMNCPKGDLVGNLAAHRASLADAAEQGADLVVFPEFSLTGSVDPVAHPEHAIRLDDPVVGALVGLTEDVGAVFGLAERDGDGCFITQVAACGGAIVSVQRKRHLGEGEEAFSTGTATATFTAAGHSCGLVVCAEAGVDWTWDAGAQARAEVIFFCSAPGLHGRRIAADSWRAGLDWWQKDAAWTTPAGRRGGSASGWRWPPRPAARTTRTFRAWPP